MSQVSSLTGNKTRCEQLFRQKSSRHQFLWRRNMEWFNSKAPTCFTAPFVKNIFCFSAPPFECFKTSFSVDKFLHHIFSNQRRRPGGAAEFAEQNKIASKYKGAFSSYTFVPLGFETFGSWGPQRKKFLYSIARKQSDVIKEKRSSCFLRQRISLEIQRRNAACVLGT